MKTVGLSVVGKWRATSTASSDAVAPLPPRRATRSGLLVIAPVRACWSDSDRPLGADSASRADGVEAAAPPGMGEAEASRSFGVAWTRRSGASASGSAGRAISGGIELVRGAGRVADSRSESIVRGPGPARSAGRDVASSRTTAGAGSSGSGGTIATRSAPRGRPGGTSGPGFRNQVVTPRSDRGTERGASATTESVAATEGKPGRAAAVTP